jgi:hypothetical protein
MLLKNFFFDYISFQKEIKPILPEIDRGDYRLLYEGAETVFRKVKPQDWLLEDQGTMLDPSYKLDGITSKVDVGYLLLVILSTYLKPAPYLYTDGNLLRKVLTLTGWNEIDIELFWTGIPISILIKENVLMPKDDPLYSERYWNWVIPTQSNTSGWITFEQIQKFKNKFIDTSQKVERFPISMLEMLSSNVSEDPKNMPSRIKTVLTNVQGVLTKAEQMKWGLYIIFS